MCRSRRQVHRPAPGSWRRRRSKIAARERMQAAGVPVVPGTVTPLRDVDEAVATAVEIGYPVMLVAAAGGGGKGMRLVASAADLPSSFRQAQSGSPECVWRRSSLSRERTYALGTSRSKSLPTSMALASTWASASARCSATKRSSRRRRRRCWQATTTREEPHLGSPRGAQAVDYASAGTVEMLMDADRAPYFLEMNTRLQVEHPVTEPRHGPRSGQGAVILIAAGHPLCYKQGGHPTARLGDAVPRVCGGPRTQLLPPGKITHIERPGAEHPHRPGRLCRLDRSADYDPLLAKLCAWAPRAKR
ncbi:MAG: hypothetical protein R2748_06985 [Bryobacterales bacterium]